jgi:hypothetical protein
MKLAVLNMSQFLCTLCWYEQSSDDIFLDSKGKKLLSLVVWRNLNGGEMILISKSAVLRSLLRVSPAFSSSTVDQLGSGPYGSRSSHSESTTRPEGNNGDGSTHFGFETVSDSEKTNKGT